MIYTYKDTNPRSGIPVSFQVQKNNITYHMCCIEQNGIKTLQFKEGGTPDFIDGSKSKIIFFEKALSRGLNNLRMFESAFYENQYLAFEEVDRRHNILTLKEIDKMDEIREDAAFYAVSTSE
ncbi:interleukin-18-like [Protopterus annectens]|uniref:interleukin-18-like n=1 Tax=Protopterus annectens TaxID=7888 RepID=UPI001CFAD200|nr:interleukin-18-like [Protopterus annectens]